MPEENRKSSEHTINSYGYLSLNSTRTDYRSLETAFLNRYGISSGIFGNNGMSSGSMLPSPINEAADRPAVSQIVDQNILNDDEALDFEKQPSKRQKVDSLLSGRKSAIESASYLENYSSRAPPPSDFLQSFRFNFYRERDEAENNDLYSHFKEPSFKLTDQVKMNLKTKSSDAKPSCPVIPTSGRVKSRRDREAAKVLRVGGDIFEELGWVKDKYLAKAVTGPVLLVHEEGSAKKFVVKLFDKRNSAGKMKGRREFYAEVATLQVKALRHPNIISLFMAVKGPDQYAIAVPYCEGGDFHRLGTSLNLENLPKYIKQACAAVHHLHKNRYIHGDIKPDNLFLNKNNDLILGDLGQAQQLDEGHDLCDEWGGTTICLAPEFEEKYVDGIKMDVWALGITIYYMCVAHDNYLTQKCFKPSYLDQLTDIEEKFICILKRMLCEDPETRANMEEIMELLME